MLSYVKLMPSPYSIRKNIEYTEISIENPVRISQMKCQYTLIPKSNIL